MLEKILTSCDAFPPHLHRHVLQSYTFKHRRAPASEREQRRAVFEYLTRTQFDKSGTVRVHMNPELEAWLTEQDEHVRGWGPVPRLVGLVHQFSRDFRLRYDLGTERDYKACLCRVALSLQGALRWPEAIVGDAMRKVLWEALPGIAPPSRLGLTRALGFVSRNSAVRNADLSRLADFSALLLRVLSDIDQGRLPEYALSPDQYDYLSQPVKPRPSRLRITGLLHHFIVERGMVREEDLSRPDIVETLAHEIPVLLTRMRLPRRLQEAHAVAPAIVAPVPAPPRAAESVPVVTVVGALTHGSGLGAAARACVEAFKSAAIPVEVLNLRAAWGNNDEDQGSGMTTHVRGDINVIHLNPDVIIENLSNFGLEQFEGRYNIGMFWWETSKACFAHRLGADLLDEVWVATPFLKEVFEKVTRKPVFVVRTPVPRIGDLAWANRGCFEIPEEKFTFVFTFDGASRFTRKNPLAGVEAFQRAFPGQDDVQLVVKTQNTGFLAPQDEKLYAEIRRRSREDRRIIVIDENFSSNEVHGLISVCDCYVALQRSEGFGFGMAEAMKLRVPVIATGYSGNAVFTTEATAWPVRYSVVPVPRGAFVYDEPGQEWAEPDLAHAVERMREVRSDPQRKVKVERAYELISSQYDEASVGRTYRQRIAAIRSRLGAASAASLAA